MELKDFGNCLLLNSFSVSKYFGNITRYHGLAEDCNSTQTGFLWKDEYVSHFVGQNTPVLYTRYSKDSVYPEVSLSALVKNVYEALGVFYQCSAVLEGSGQQFEQGLSDLHQKEWHRCKVTHFLQYATLNLCN